MFAKKQILRNFLCDQGHTSADIYFHHAGEIDDKIKHLTRLRRKYGCQHQSENRGGGRQDVDDSCFRFRQSSLVTEVAAKPRKAEEEAEHRNL